MKIEIYGETPQPEETMYLRLVPARNGDGITLIVVDTHGSRLDAGSLLTIKENGRSVLYSSVSDTIGLDLTAQSRLNFSQE